MKLRSRCFPLEYYPGEVLTEVEARRRRKHITCYTLIICSLWASNLGVRQIKSETNGFQTRTEIHRVIHDLRGGVNLTEAAWLLITIWMLQQQSTGFQPINLVLRPPHLQGLYGNQQPGNQFRYGKGAGPRSIKVVGATQNAGSDKKQPSSGSWNYKDVMRELGHQSSRKKLK